MQKVVIKTMGHFTLEKHIFSNSYHRRVRYDIRYKGEIISSPEEEPLNFQSYVKSVLKARIKTRTKRQLELQQQATAMKAEILKFQEIYNETF
jgi:hypothetical protein